MTSPVGIPISSRPSSPWAAVDRALRLLADPSNATHCYMLGTGDAGDLPWTERDGVSGSDCAGFAICWCYGLRRHRPGFNAGPWASVSDDINVDSAIEDSEHKRELFVPAAFADARIGDLIVYPTIHLAGHPQPWIGHVGIVVGVGDGMAGLDIVQCCGPNGREPAVVRTGPHAWQHHDQLWPLPQHRSRLLRVVP